MPASKSGLACGLLLGFRCSKAEWRKAYCQFPFVGVPMWVELPAHEWSAHWKGQFRLPVCPLERNLHGQPQAGPLYERWAAKQLIPIGFLPLENWPSVLCPF